MKEKSLAKQLENEKERARYYEVLVGKIQTALFESKDPLEEVASIVLKTVVRSRLAEKAEEVFNG